MPATKKKRTWAGLVCPVCRFVFRVPKDHVGAGVICPACHHLLNIPAAGNKTVSGRDPSEVEPKTLASKPRGQKKSKAIVSRPLSEKDTLPVPTVLSETKAGLGGDSRKKAPPLKTANQPVVHRKKQRSQPTPEWENQTNTTNDSEANPLMWIAGGALVGVTIVGVGAWLVIDSLDNKKENTMADIQEAPAASAPTMVTEDKMTPDEKKRQQEIADSVKTGMNVLSEAEHVVRKFLTAESASDLEALVRTPEVTVPKMRAWYAKNKWITPDVKDIGYGGRVTVKGVMASMAVRLGDYSVKQIALERTADGYKVDWESWVAWSSLGWEELFTERPTEPVKVRVQCSRDSYYNRIFNDDSKWTAVKLIHPRYEKVIYGYVDNNSPSLMRLLGDLRGRGMVAATIKISYPKDSVADNQVYITEYIQNGWVRASDQAGDGESTTPDN